MLGSNVIRERPVPVEVIGRAVGEHGHVRHVSLGLDVPELKAAQLQHHPVVGDDSVEPVQEAAAEIAAQPDAAPGRPEDGCGHRRGGRFAVRAGHAHDPRGTHSQEHLDLRGDLSPRLSGDVHKRVSRPHRGIDDQTVGLSEILFLMPAKVKGRDRLAGQFRERIGQDALVGQVRHGDDRTLPGQPPGSGHPAAEMAQAHDGDSFVSPVHGELGSRQSV